MSFFPIPMYLTSPPPRCRYLVPTTTSAAVRRHHRRRLLKHSPATPPQPPPPSIFKLTDDNTLQITIKPPSNYIKRFETKLNQFVSSGQEALDDLKTIATVYKENGALVFSLRKSSIDFLAVFFLSSSLVVFTLWNLLKNLLKWGRRKEGFVEELEYKRDRSLGGKLVLVGKKASSTTTPLSGSDSDSYYYPTGKKRATMLREKKRKEQLPQWWPQLVNSNLGLVEETSNKEEYQRLANTYVRAIMDRKMSGRDVSPNDVIQLRHICKTFGVRAFIETANARDSLYRAAINFVLSYCESIANISTSVQINGEDAREFIAGLADNIGLENIRAARMVSGAVAARTRSKILQAWALEVQDKHTEALEELFKVCFIHRIFPPEEGSAEMEMVARGLERNLSIEQRESILKSLIDVCGEDMHRSVAEALGLEGVKQSPDTCLNIDV